MYIILKLHYNMMVIN